MSELPGGWAVATLNDLLGAGGLFSDGDWVESKDQDPDGQNRLLQLADIGDGFFIDKSSRFVNDEKFASLNCTEVKEGDVLIARMPDPLGRACLMPAIPQRCLTVVDVAVFRVGKTGVSNKWLMYFLNSSSVRQEIELNSSGSTRKRISRGKLGEILLPVPPLAEQTRIAQKLDELLAQVDTLKARIDGIPALLKRFRQSVLAAAVSGRLTEEWRESNQVMAINLDALGDVAKTRRGVPEKVRTPDFLSNLAKPEAWIWASAANLLRKGIFIDLKDGNHGANHPKASEFTPEGIPFITAANVSKSGFIDYANAPKVSGSALDRLRVGFSEPEDVIFTHKGTVGRVAINSRKCVLTPQTTYYRLNQQILLNGYFAIFLQSNRFRIQTDEVKSQTTRDFIPITAQYELFHLIPPLSEQSEIVRRVEQLFAFADQLEAKVASAKSRIDHLTQSTLAKAFRGELVPQDPNDEPASVLLERIKAQRAAAPKAKRGRKAKETA